MQSLLNGVSQAKDQISELEPKCSDAKTVTLSHSSSMMSTPFPSKQVEPRSWRLETIPYGRKCLRVIKIRDFASEKIL